MAKLIDEDLPYDHIKNGGKKEYEEFNFFLAHHDSYVGFLLWQLDRDQSHPDFEQAVEKIIRLYHAKQMKLSMYFWGFLINRKNEDDFHVESRENREQRSDFSFVHRQFERYSKSLK